MVIDIKRKLIAVEDDDLSLPPKLFCFLELLACKDSKVFSDEKILEHVWTEVKYAGTNGPWLCVYGLRW